MICAWKQLLSILPTAIRHEVDRLGRETAQEVRLRMGQKTELVLSSGSRWLEHTAGESDLRFVINTASQYSPWASATMAEGYITGAGGHRIGICGIGVTQNGVMTGIRRVQSICIRVARDFPDLARKIPWGDHSVLILGPPGSGKTTLLRDLIRRISECERGSVAVVDERSELFPEAGDFPRGRRTDVLTHCPKPQGILTALKTMGPAWIAVDEITAQEDCQALMQAAWCGVRLLATAHAADKKDLLRRSIYKPLAECGLFDTLIVLNRDKSWKVERMCQCQ